MPILFNSYLTLKTLSYIIIANPNKKIATTAAIAAPVRLIQVITEVYSNIIKAPIR